MWKTITVEPYSFTAFFNFSLVDRGTIIFFLLGSSTAVFSLGIVEVEGSVLLYLKIFGKGAKLCTLFFNIFPFVQYCFLLSSTKLVLLVLIFNKAKQAVNNYTWYTENIYLRNLFYHVHLSQGIEKNFYF